MIRCKFAKDKIKLVPYLEVVREDAGLLNVLEKCGWRLGLRHFGGSLCTCLWLRVCVCALACVYVCARECVFFMNARDFEVEFALCFTSRWE